MAINLHCSSCKTSCSLKSKYCPKCGFDFGNGRKYRVVIKAHDGRRVSKVLNGISMAQKFEAKLKTQAIEKKLFGINQVPLIDDIWKEYLKWAKNNKKSWKGDQENWKKHIEPILKGKKFDSIILFTMILRSYHSSKVMRN